MLNRMLVGTAATLNTFFAPLVGVTDPTNATYKLVETSPAQVCAHKSSNFVRMKIDSSLEDFITLQVDGQLCSFKGQSQPVAFRLILPADLLDEEFLLHLPTDAAYVISGLPPMREGGPQTRVKITKREAVGNAIPLQIEWLPSEGHVEHAPMTVWMKRSLAGNSGLPWEKIEFSELPHDLLQPLAFAGEILNTKLK